MGLPKRRLQAWKGFDKNKSVSGHSEHLSKGQLFREWMSQQFKMAGDQDVILWTAELVLDFCFCFSGQTFFLVVVCWKWIDLLFVHFCVPCKQKTKLVEVYTENRFLSWSHATVISNSSILKGNGQYNSKTEKNFETKIPLLVEFIKE